MRFQNSNRGLIWSNDRKTRGNNPDYTGSLNVKGEEFWISAWKQRRGESEEGETLLCSVRPKEKAPIEQPKDYIVNTENQSGDWI